MYQIHKHIELPAAFSSDATKFNHVCTVIEIVIHLVKHYFSSLMTMLFAKYILCKYFVMYLNSCKCTFSIVCSFLVLILLHFDPLICSSIQWVVCFSSTFNRSRAKTEEKKKPIIALHIFKSQALSVCVIFSREKNLCSHWK